VLIIAGSSLRCLPPHVWDVNSPYYLPDLKAVMVSYAEFHRMPARRRKAMEQGLHEYLGIPEEVKIYLDNGAFYFLSRDGEMPREEYDEFVRLAKPDWWPIPQDFIPSPRMTIEEQRNCFNRTMQVNLAYQHDGYVPVIHICRVLEEYTIEIKAHERLSEKPTIALGGIVPNLMRAPRAMTHKEILVSLRHVRQTFTDKQIHVFGIGGTSTLHIAALLGMDSVDSSGWRNRAARGIVQLPGSGDRMVAELGKWVIRKPSKLEWDILSGCTCPACNLYGLDGLKANAIGGFCNRATHNLWVLLEEVRWIERHLADGTYTSLYKQRLDNSIYLPLIDQILETSQ
jgi:7-cyano-7-deazaguanine tRNA-ribosyltransferase